MLGLAKCANRGVQFAHEKRSVKRNMLSSRRERLARLGKSRTVEWFAKNVNGGMWVGAECDEGYWKLSVCVS